MMSWEKTIHAKWSFTAPEHRICGTLELVKRLLPLVVHVRSVIEPLPDFKENQRQLGKDWRRRALATRAGYRTGDPGMGSAGSGQRHGSDFQ
jgi:hypothetical protein